MKKILSIMFAFLLIFSCFAVIAFAEDVAIDLPDYDYYGAIYYETQPVITLSDDYKKLYVDDEPFSRVDMSMLSTDFGYTVDVAYEYNSSLRNSVYADLTDKQKEDIEDILIETNLVKNMYRIELYFNDGSNLTVYFLKDTMLDEYNEIINGETEKYQIDFAYPDGNIVIAEKSALFGEIVTLAEEELFRWYDFFSVSAQNSDGSIVVYTGDLILIDDSYFYIDYAESNIEEAFWLDEFAESKYSDVIIHKITDEKLLADLQNAMKLYYEDDYGVLYDDDTTDIISAVFFILVFAFVPAVILVIFLVKAIRGKGVYKKIYGTVTAICAAEIIVFTIIAAILVNLNS